MFYSSARPGFVTEPALLGGRIHADYRGKGTKQLLALSAGLGFMMASPTPERILTDAVRSKYWDGKLKSLTGILRLERQWVRSHT